MTIPWWLLGFVIIISGIAVLQFFVLVGVMLIVGGAVTAMVFYSLRPKYPVRALIFMKRHGTVRLIWDQAARRETEKGSGTFYYRFKKLKSSAKAATYENLYPSGRGEIALFFSPAPGEFYQAIFKDKQRRILQVKDDEGKITTYEDVGPIVEPIPDDLLEWTILKQQRMKQRFMTTNMWDKYYPFIVAAIMMVMITIVVAALFNSMKPVTESWERSAQANERAAARIAEAIEKLVDSETGTQTTGGGGGPLPPPPPDV